MKRSLIYLIVLLFVAATAWAGDASTKTTTAKACAMDSTCAKKCAGMAAAAKEAGDKTADPHAACPMMNKASEKADASAKGADVIPATAEEKGAAQCPMHMGKAEMKAATPAVTVETAPTIDGKKPELPSAEMKTADEKVSLRIPEGSCPDVSASDKLMNFHKAMEPIHLAVNTGKYEKLPALMPNLQEASKGIADYKCPDNEKCTPECLKNFESKKTALMKAAEELSLVASSTDTKKIDEGFYTMHNAFVDLANMSMSKGEVKNAVETK